MIGLCLIFVSAGGGLLEPIEDCLRFLVGEVPPVLFCIPGTQVLGPDFQFVPISTRMSL